MTAVRVFHVGLHFGEEPFVAGNECSAMVNMAGCHLACHHCYTPEATSGRFGEDLDKAAFVTRLESLLENGAKNVNVVSPTAPWLALEPMLEAFRQKHPTVPVVLKTSGYEGAAFLRRMARLADVFVPDFKSLSPDAARAAGLPSAYGAVAIRALAVLDETHGHPREDENGKLRRGVVVRYLWMPGFEADGLAIVDALGRRGFRGWLNVMTRFVRPAGGLVRAPKSFVATLVDRARAEGLRIAVDGDPIEERSVAYASGF